MQSTRSSPLVRRLLVASAALAWASAPARGSEPGIPAEWESAPTPDGYETGEVWALAETPSGDVLAAGFSEANGAATRDAVLAKLSASGELLWLKAFGQAERADAATSVAANADGGCLLAGWTTGAGDDSDYPPAVFTESSSTSARPPATLRPSFPFRKS